MPNGADLEQVVGQATGRATSKLLAGMRAKPDGAFGVHVVFVDIVSYTQRNSKRQAELAKALQDLFAKALVATEREYKADLDQEQAELSRDTIILPLGDGMAVAFPFPNLFRLPLFFAKRLFSAVADHNEDCARFRRQHWCSCHANLKLRCGVASGTAIMFLDANGRPNLAGAPVNEAARLMGVADPGQIFANDKYVEMFKELDTPRGLFRPYVATVKHGVTLPAYQFRQDNPGVNTSTRPDLGKAGTSPRQEAPVVQPTPVQRPKPSKQEAALTASASPTGLPPHVRELEKRLIPVPVADFFMGDRAREQFSVRLSRPFLVDAFPVTQGLYQAVCDGHNPSHFLGEDLRPVDSATWYEAVEFCNRLSLQAYLAPVYTMHGREVSADFTRNGYRLPTEAEWEICALRDEQKFGGGGRTEDIAWCRANSQATTQIVGGKRRVGSPIAGIM